MTYDNTQFRPAYRQKLLHPAFGLAAVAATAMTLSGITAALAREVMSLLRLMSLLSVGASTVAAVSG